MKSNCARVPTTVIRKTHRWWFMTDALELKQSWSDQALSRYDLLICNTMQCIPRHVLYKWFVNPSKARILIYYHLLHSHYNDLFLWTFDQFYCSLSRDENDQFSFLNVTPQSGPGYARSRDHKATGIYEKRTGQVFRIFRDICRWRHLKPWLHSISYLID